MTAPMLAEDCLAERTQTVESRPRRSGTADLARSIAGALRLHPTDALLDLGCGDGAVSKALHASAGSLLGVDRSAAAVASARLRWEQPSLRFTVGSPPGFTATAATPWRFTAAVWYGTLGPSASPEVLATLKALAWRFRRIRVVLLTNVHPAPAKSGTWLQSEDELALLAAAGWYRAPFRSASGEDWAHALLARGTEGGWSTP